MSDLYITPTRWDLLRAIFEERVLYLPDEDRGDQTSWDTTDAETGMPARRVGARVDELERAGLARLAADDGVTWLLTAEGMDVLTAHTCLPCGGYTPSAPTCGTCKGRVDS